MSYEDEYGSSGGTTTVEEKPADDLLDRVLAATPPYSMGAEALAATVKAEVDIQISTAKSYPRNLKAFRADAMTLATLDEKTAGACFYKVPRGGKTIEGPSVRLAEIVANAWGNLRTSTRIISIDKETLTAQAMCHDLETNVASIMEVRRRITDKYGKRYNEDMITMTANAAASIAYRNAIFKVVPFAHVKPVYDQAKLVSLGKGKTFEQQLQMALDHWHKQGVSDERIAIAVSQPSIKDLTVDDLITLRGFYTAIKEGETTLDDCFPKSRPEANGQSLQDKLAARAASVKTTEPTPPNNGTTAPATSTPPTDKAPEKTTDKPQTAADESDAAMLREQAASKQEAAKQEPTKTSKPSKTAGMFGPNNDAQKQ